MVLLLKHMLWNYKLLFGQTTMGRIHACCRETDYVANTRFLSLVLTQIFRILLRFYSDFTQISAQKIGYWELCFPYLDYFHLDNAYLDSPNWTVLIGTPPIWTKGSPCQI